MASGIFLVGDGLSIEGFNHYIANWFIDKNKGEVKDKMKVGINDSKKLLISLVNVKGITELELGMAMTESANEMEKDNTGQEYREKPYCSYPHQVRADNKGIYEIIGSYSVDSTASDVFAPLAVKYAAIDSGREIENLIKKLRNFGERFEK